MLLNNTLEFSDSHKIYYDFVFYRKRDANRYLDTFGGYKEYFEVVGATLDESEKDNRKNETNNRK